MKKKLKLLVMSGPSGVGKDTLIKRVLQERCDVQKVISYTTRPIRTGEEENYIYVSRNQLSRLKEQGKVLEEVVFKGELYATPYPNDEYDGWQIYNVDPRGMAFIKEKYSEEAKVLSVFVAPPSRESLKQRLIHRGDSEQEIIERMKTVDAFLSEQYQYNHVIVNDSLEEATAQLLKILEDQDCIGEDPIMQDFSEVLKAYRKTEADFNELIETLNRWLEENKENDGEDFTS